MEKASPSSSAPPFFLSQDGAWRRMGGWGGGAVVLKMFLCNKVHGQIAHMQEEGNEANSL